MINVIGNIFDSSGYSIHTRELANALMELTNVSLSVSLPTNWERAVNDKELEAIKREPDNKINLIITNPMHWRLHTEAKRNWVYLVWEGDKVPDSFIEECLNPDIEYIFVPSNHTYQAILSTLHNNFSIQNPFKEGTQIPKGFSSLNDVIIPKIKIIPHGVDLIKFYPIEKKEETFTFLVNKGFRNLEDRGGTQYVIKAYLEEFTKEDNVELLIKINPAYGIPDIDKLIKELGWNENCAKITIDINNYDYKDLVHLYNKGNIFVSPTRAEAFNIPCIEAMACGLPVITTSFGGQTDYCDKETGWIIDGELTEIEHELQYEGIKWLTPNIEELKLALRTATQENLTSKKEKAIETSKKYQWTTTARLIHDLI